MLERFARRATDIGYSAELKGDHLVIGRNSLFSFHLSLQEPDRCFAYFYVRTTSWTFPGERTDLHHALSIILAAGLRVSVPCSPELLDQGHPVAGIPGELYGRYISLNQPSGSLIADNDGHFDTILTSVYLAHVGIHDALIAGKDLEHASYSHDSEELITWSALVAEWVEAGGNAMQAARDIPEWLHFYEPDAGLSVMRCPRAAQLLRALTQSESLTLLEGPTAWLFVQEDIRNAAPRSTVEWVLEAVRRFDTPDDRGASAALAATRPAMPRGLSTLKPGGTLVIPMENWLVGIGENVVVARKGDFGRRAFRPEHSAVRQRQQLENRVLFPVGSFRWVEPIDGGRFEELVRAMLEREPGILRVRPVGVPNEPDGGRDFICDWVVPDAASGSTRDDETAPARTLKVIVQCKSSRKPIGKSSVPDIYDVVHQYRVDGYLLAAFPRITVPLLDKLESLDLSLVEWWERYELEARLRDNQDVLTQFTDLVWADESSESDG